LLYIHLVSNISPDGMHILPLVLGVVRSVFFFLVMVVWGFMVSYQYEEFFARNEFDGHVNGFFFLTLGLT